MVKDYIPFIAALLAVFVITFIYDSLLDFVKRKSPKSNRQLAFIFNIVALLAVFALIGFLFYLIIAAITSAADGSRLFNVQF
jgi:predicted PurR-regulated permease PerM